jgi:hypothetical protein
MPITSPTDAKTFATAGRATITLASKKTGQHYTYRIVKAEPEPSSPFFVSLLTGPDNQEDFNYIGLLTSNLVFKLTNKSRLPLESQPVAAFRFFALWVLTAGTIPEALEVRHEGKCGRCNRPLTVPGSIDRGIGPDCAKIMCLAA